MALPQDWQRDVFVRQHELQVPGLLVTDVAAHGGSEHGKRIATGQELAITGDIQRAKTQAEAMLRIARRCAKRGITPDARGGTAHPQPSVLG